MHHNDDNAGIVKHKYLGRNRQFTNHVQDPALKPRKTELPKIENFVLASEPDQKYNGGFWP
jgi:hypothetical protein